MTLTASPPSAPAPAARASLPAARLEQVRKRFGYRDVLRGLSLEVPRGGCFVITGPNGAGKSTLIRIIATLWTFHEGSVQVCGHDVRKDPRSVRAKIGAVLHESFLRRELSLEENLRFACELRGLHWTRERERLDELLRRLRIDHRRHDAVGTFSQGMLKRAGIARSLVGAPELWLLDEPFSGLDPAGRETLTELIAAAGAAGTVLLVTHEVELARRLATGAAHIEDGVAVAAGKGPMAAGGAGPAREEEP